MIAGMLLLNQVLNKKEKQHKQVINNKDHGTINNTYFTDIRDIKGNLKGVIYVKT